MEDLIRQLRECRFQDDAEISEEAPEEDNLTIGIPRENFTDSALENLQKIIANKQTLFQSAFRTDSTEIEITEEKINFTCFFHIVIFSHLCYNINRFKKCIFFADFVDKSQKKYTIYMKVNILT